MHNERYANSALHLKWLILEEKWCVEYGETAEKSGSVVVKWCSWLSASGYTALCGSEAD